jgi:hypothetical protein
MSDETIACRSADDSLLFDARVPEVDEEADTKPGGAEVVHALRHVNAVQGTNGFDFDEDFAIYKQVSDVLAHHLPFEHDVHRHLLFDDVALRSKLDHECILVRLLKETAAQLIAHLETRPKDRCRAWIA